MNNDAPRTGIGRRGFLKTAGLAAGAALLPGAGYWAWRSAGPKEALKLALLWPRAGRSSAQLDAWLAGFALKAEQSGGRLGGREFVLSSEAIGPAGTPFTAVRQNLEQGADILIAGVGPGVAAQLSADVAEHDATLVASGIGVNIPRAAEVSEHVIHAGSSQWQAEWALGAHAARQVGQRGVIASSLYESGFDGVYAFRRGFEGAGGELLDTLISHRPIDPPDLAPLMARIAEFQPDFVYAAYTRREAREFLQAFRQAGLGKHVPLLVSGFFADDAALPELGQDAVGLRSAAPWLPTTAAADNVEFQRAFLARHGRAADAFAVLGYQTAQLLDAAIGRSRGEGRGRRFREALATVQLDGPAGRLRVDPALRAAATPVYLREVRAEAGGLIGGSLGQLADGAAIDPRRDPVFMAVRSGWTNAYMSI